jgi:predicted nucleotidyltransferase
MRLNDSEQAAIRATVKSFDAVASVYLFGSRVDDSKKGGDIDLLILSGRLGRDESRAIKSRLYEILGEQKIDIVVAADASDPFVCLALQTGIPL